MGNYNWDALGMMPKKARPRLADINVDTFSPAIQEVAKFLYITHGKEVDHVELDPYTERWLFYGPRFSEWVDSVFICAIPHDMMETIYEQVVKEQRQLEHGDTHG